MLCVHESIDFGFVSKQPLSGESVVMGWHGCLLVCINSTSIAMQLFVLKVYISSYIVKSCLPLVC